MIPKLDKVRRCGVENCLSRAFKRLIMRDDGNDRVAWQKAIRLVILMMNWEG